MNIVLEWLLIFAIIGIAAMISFVRFYKKLYNITPEIPTIPESNIKKPNVKEMFKYNQNILRDGETL